MRKITERIKEAFDKNVSMKIDNSEVVFNGESTKMYLFGNLIAKKDINGIQITCCGWLSKTTKDRLSAFIPIRTEKRKWYYHMNDSWHL